MYVETEAEEREQIMRACAAQNDKLLPKPKGVTSNSAARLKASASKYFPSTDKQ